MSINCEGVQKSIIEDIQRQWRNEGTKGMGSAWNTEAFRKSASAVCGAFGDDDILAEAVSIIEGAAFNAGFARALCMLEEAREVLK